MRSVIRAIIVVYIAALVPAVAVAGATDATLFRIFLADGTTLVSFGEFARVGDEVIFSMPAGGTPEDPRLHIVTLPSASVDWARTDRYAVSARYQRYAATSGEEDFQRLNNDVARVLSDIALSTDRRKALAIAQDARRTMADWPRTHYGYRQNDVREIVGLLDEAINSLSAPIGTGSIELALAADTPIPIDLEPVYGMPTAREQLDQLLKLASMTGRPAERVALLQSALALISDPRAGLPSSYVDPIRKATEARIRDEAETDRRYAEVSLRLTAAAGRAAARARVNEVEQILARVAVEDRKLGKRRDEAVQALRASVETHLASARHLRLLRDQWIVRRSIYREYERSIGPDTVTLVKLQPLLESIRKLEGPAPDRLAVLRSRLSGGAERLQRRQIPEFLAATHELLVTAWRFAEQAANARYTAVTSGNVGTAWEASSAAAGAMMMLTRAQQELRSLIEPPRLR
jgi:hypothetical protein